MKKVILCLFLASCFTAPAAAKLDLNRKDQRKCKKVLLDGLRSDEFWSSMHAAEGLTLGGFGDVVRKHCASKLPKEKNHQHRCGLARELVRAGDRQKSQVMMKILSDLNSTGRVHAAESLYKVGWTGSSKPLEKAFAGADDLRLKYMAAAALGKKGSQQAMKFLRDEMRTQEDTKLLYIPAWILSRIGNKSDIPLIRKRLADAPDAWMKSFLEHALAALGDPDGQKALWRNLKSEDPRLRTYAAVFAGDARMLDTKAQLLEQLADENLDARIRAAQTLLFLSR
ncbi:MAG: HEAT repeat domain-containing protein [Limisphaerales bacterium]